MILSDRIAGPLLTLGGAATVAASTLLPAVPGVRFGADVMQRIIATLLVVCGIAIAIGGFHRPAPLLDPLEWRVPLRQILAALWSTFGMVAVMALFR